VYTDDLRAIQFILSQADAFHKSSFVRQLVTSMLGKSLFVADGAYHRAQRRVMNPGFGPVQVRELSGIFLDKANQVRIAHRKCTSSIMLNQSSCATNGWPSLTAMQNHYA
jgi:cytochrome P450